MRERHELVDDVVEVGHKKLIPGGWPVTMGLVDEDVHHKFFPYRGTDLNDKHEAVCGEKIPNTWIAFLPSHEANPRGDVGFGKYLCEDCAEIIKTAQARVRKRVSRGQPSERVA